MDSILTGFRGRGSCVVAVPPLVIVCGDVLDFECQQGKWQLTDSGSTPRDEAGNHRVLDRLDGWVNDGCLVEDIPQLMFETHQGDQFISLLNRDRKMR